MLVPATTSKGVAVDGERMQEQLSVLADGFGALRPRAGGMPDQRSVAVRAPDHTVAAVSIGRSIGGASGATRPASRIFTHTASLGTPCS